MEWLAVEVEHMASIAGMSNELARLTGLSARHVYEIKIFAVPSSMQYRAPQTPSWPRIYGFENGLVMGPADSEYAQIDADGRYLVRFEFDTSDLPDAKVSTRVRMLQPHGGQTEGFHFPLRKNTEVMLAFLGGDPDRPVIAGVVPNAEKPSVVGQRNHTQNIIRTGSNNQLVFEDQKGKEFIFLHTPNNATGIYMGNPAGPQGSVYTGEQTKPMSFSSPDNAGPVTPGAQPTMVTSAISFGKTTKGNYGLSVGGDAFTDIAGIQSVFVKGNTSHGYASTFKLQVGGDSNEFYYSHRNTEITSGRKDTVHGGGMEQEIHGGLTQTIEPGGKSTVTGGWTHKVTAENHDDYGTWKTDVSGAWAAKFAGGSVTIDAKPSNLHIHSGGEIKMDAVGKIEITAPNVKVSSTAFMAHYLSAKHESYLYKGTTGAS